VVAVASGDTAERPINGRFPGYSIGENHPPVSGQYGDLSISADGSYTYTLRDPGSWPQDGDFKDVFTYLLNDTDGPRDDDLMASLTIYVDPDNHQVTATSGNDTLVYNGVSAVEGGGGIDTLLLSPDVNIDFDNLQNLTNIERIDLGNGQHSLSNLSVHDVLSITGDDHAEHSLTIFGDAGDSVSLKNESGAEWASSGSEVIDGHAFDVYTNAYDSTVKVLIEQQIHID
jgi:hypothetical protein